MTGAAVQLQTSASLERETVTTMVSVSLDWPVGRTTAAPSTLWPMSMQTAVIGQRVTGATMHGPAVTATVHAERARETVTATGIARMGWCVGMTTVKRLIQVHIPQPTVVW